jgi:uncharacterized protein YjiS (DUF1127 family)
MSIAVFKSPAARPSWLRPILDWLRHARAALAVPPEDLDRLSDRQLADIGAERPDIARAVDQEVGRLGLLDIGWQQPRRPLRR